MSTGAEYNNVVDAAYQALSEVGDNPTQLPEPFRTVVLVDTAKGIIDNGGIKYFFEANFPFSPEYSVFTSAFRNIGLVEAANDIDRAVAMFPFENPHMHADKRNEFMSSVESDPAGEFQCAGDRVMGDKDFDMRVVTYAKSHGFHAA